ncbi:peptidoglycan GlcNAc deacetylase [Bifidobacterium pullorum]|uniref:Peptidoglycan GlcNAc deacetylase n=1 Tax=Bifidobacterium pullorum TaxID=78448 RepID=A0A7V8KQS5_9BIFI|nr:peptidoglycan GlcNAc deacetylase [Bifidobacterium pullorum]
MMKGLRKQRWRIHPVAMVIIALFTAGLVFAGYSIIHGLLQSRSETHQEALADCRSAQQRFSTTYTTYRATMSSAQRLAETGESDVANPASVSDLAGTIAPMLEDTSADALSNRACYASMSDDDLNALAHDFGISDSTMVNRMITVQYQADQVKDGIETMRTTNARARLSSLTSRARLAYERSAGKADEGLRAALQAAFDAAQQLLDAADIADDAAYADAADAVRAATDAVVAVLPFDCHFHDCVALTFDDGPNKQFTPQLLDALADAGVPATFFVQGQFVSGSNVDLVGRMAAEGHDVGSISWRHTQLHTLDAGTLAKWFKDTDEVISAASGRPVTLFRPPDGAWSDTVRDQAQASGESIILWNVDSGDWRGADAGTITTTVVDGGGPPARSWPCTTATDLPSRRSRVLCRDCATRD